MIKAYSNCDENLLEINSLVGQDLWVDIVNPTEADISIVTDRFGIKAEFIKSALDYDENPRIETASDQILILVNMPIIETKEQSIVYNTFPLGIIVTRDVIVTVSIEKSKLIDEILNLKGIFIRKKTRFVLQLLYYNANLFLKHLKEIEKISTEIEQYVNKSFKNEELVKLLNLEKSLVYFSTALQANEMVLERLLRSYLRRTRNGKSEMTMQILQFYEEDEDLLEDVITENKQAIALVSIYTNISSNTMDAFASIISNNINIVMKFLAIVTIALAIPTIIMSYYGMNVQLPFQENPLAHFGVIMLSIILMIVSAWFLNKKK